MKPPHDAHTFGRWPIGRALACPMGRNKSSAHFPVPCQHLLTFTPPIGDGICSMMESLLRFDRSLFNLVNGEWHNEFFDWLMPWLRNSSVWAPLYLFVVLYAIVNHKGNGWRLVAVAMVAVALSDLLSSSLIKPNVFRLRPCNEPSLADAVRVLVGYRPQSSSFTSSHAVNHFTLATFLFLTLPQLFGRGRWLWFVWAGAICWAQVYVGVHYPLDVACGAVIGILIGYLHGQLFNKRYQLV